MSVLQPMEVSGVDGREPVLLPGRVYLRNRPQVTVARPTLGLVVYTDAPTEWAMEHAARIAESFVAMVGVNRFRCFMTSKLSKWRVADEVSMPALLADLRAGRVLDRARHLFTFRLADDSGAPRYGLTYREVDEKRSTRLGYLQLTLPHDHPADDLLAMALEIAQTTPIWHGVAGYMLSTNPLYAQESHQWGLAWARRCWGLHVPDLEAFARLGRSHLSGVGWLNLLGRGAIEALGVDLDHVLSHSSDGLVTMPLPRCVMLKAGDRPQLGDANLMSAPNELAVLARALDPYLPAEAPPLPAPFGELSTDWMHRFSHPEAWT